jgi:hypothetical protein
MFAEFAFAKLYAFFESFGQILLFNDEIVTAESWFTR